MGTIKFQIPDLPYSQVECEWEEYPDAIQFAANFREAFLEAFAPPAPPMGANLDPRIFSPGTTPPPVSPRQGGHTGLFCRDHNVEVLKTSDKFDKSGERY